MGNVICAMAGHDMEQIEVYHGSTAVAESTVIRDRCRRCGRVRRIVGGGGLLFPLRQWEDEL